MLGIRFRRNTFTRAEFTRQLGDITAQMSSDQQRAVTKAIGEATRAIMARLQQMERRMDARVAQLLDAVEKQQSKIDSYQALFVTMHQQVLDAIGTQLTPSDLMRVEQVFKLVNSNSDELDAAIKANTVEASTGAISDGPSAADIKAGLTPVSDPGSAQGGPVNVENPAPSTDAAAPATN